MSYPVSKPLPSTEDAGYVEQCLDTSQSEPAVRLPDVAANDDRPGSEITVEAISRHVMRPSRKKFVIRPVFILPISKPQTPRGKYWPALICASTLIGLVAAIGAREPVVRQIPQTAVVFKAIGLPVNLRALTFKDVKTRMFEDNGQQVLAVEGIITNLRTTPNRVPPLRVALKGSDGREIYWWIAQPTLTKLDAGGTLLFRTRLASPPSNAKIALVNFAEAEDSKPN